MITPPSLDIWVTALVVLFAWYLTQKKPRAHS